MRYTTPALALALASLSISAPNAQEKIDRDINWKIRREATDNTQIMRTMHFLTDVYGPRLTGSPNLKAAQDWLVKETTRWGLKNAHLEPWSFGHPGWVNEKLSVHAVSPFKDSLVSEALAWTPGTNGPVTAQVVQIIVPSQPTKDVLTRFFDETRPKVKGKIVMVGAATEVRVTILTPQKRREDNEVRAQYDPVNPTPGGGFGGGGPAARPDPNVVPAGQVAEQLDQFLVSAGAAGRINDAGREHGQIRAFNNRTFDVAKAVPTVVMRNEDYGRISRVLADGPPVEVELNIVNRSYPEGATVYNVVAEIPGTDKADEVVMLGGHLDSWHSATGATDNAIGSTTMLEAIRVLQALGVKPRRTIRVALWSGEEQACSDRRPTWEHFGMVENPKPSTPISRLLQHRLRHAAARAAQACLVLTRRRRSCAKRRCPSPTTGSSASTPPRAAAEAARTRPRSTRRACPASASNRIRSNTARTPGTPTSTPTSASSRMMLSNRRW